jgi:hypothetical protein
MSVIRRTLNTYSVSSLYNKASILGCFDTGEMIELVYTVTKRSPAVVVHDAENFPKQNFLP